MSSASDGDWNDAAVVLAANDISAELPQMSLPAIIDAAAACRRIVPAAAGTVVLRHCIRRRLLGLSEIISAPPSTDGVDPVA
jgi:hypothetical protein